MTESHHEPGLSQNLSRMLVLFYGLGTILGAGIYVLVGKVTAQAGIFSPFAFLLASVIAGFTAVSYAELSARFPKSAGEAYFVDQGFGVKALSMTVGWLVVVTGIVSTAAMARGFAGYVQVFLNSPSWFLVLMMTGLITLIAIWGIKESAILIMVITCIEVTGLLIIIGLAATDLSQLPALYQSTIPKVSVIFSGVLSGAFLAFYAYIGFEDMVNVAEEVKDPQKNMPFAIFGALFIATVMYILVACAMVLVMPIEKLGQSAAPLADFIAHKGYSPVLITLISLIAIINGALAQVIMASRVIYGMAKQNNAPKVFEIINHRTKTPVYATLMVALIILILALGFDIEWLAKLTTVIILCVFTLVNLSLIAIKRKIDSQQALVSYSIWFPIVGATLSVLFLLSQFLF